MHGRGRRSTGSAGLPQCSTSRCQRMAGSAADPALAGHSPNHSSVGPAARTRVNYHPNSSVAFPTRCTTKPRTHAGDGRNIFTPHWQAACRPYSTRGDVRKKERFRERTLLRFPTESSAGGPGIFLLLRFFLRNDNVADADGPDGARCTPWPCVAGQPRRPVEPVEPTQPDPRLAFDLSIRIPRRGGATPARRRNQQRARRRGDLQRDSLRQTARRETTQSTAKRDSHKIELLKFILIGKPLSNPAPRLVETLSARVFISMRRYSAARIGLYRYGMV